MTIDGFLTFLGLIAALIALAPEASRRSLFLRWRLNLVTSIGACALIFYLLLFDVLAPTCEGGKVCSGIRLGGDRQLDPNDAAFLLVLLWFVAVGVSLIWKRPLGTRHLVGLAALANAFAAEKRFLELAQLVEPHLALIDRVAGRHDPKTTRAHAAAKSLQRLLFETRELGEFIALERPKMAVAMMAQKHHRVFGFADFALRLLADRPGSPLYTEIENNKTVTRVGYVLRPENTYLTYLFGDARNADRLMAWQPVMDAAIDRLEDARGEAYERFLNQKPIRFEDRRWSDPTFVAIRFLDIMVDAAMRQNVPSHMWLVYLPQLADRLIALYDDSGDGVDRHSETPTRAAHLLGDLVQVLGGWIHAVIDLPPGAHHLAIDTPRAAPQGDNIPKSAILALGDVVADVLVAPNLGQGFKHHLAEMAFRLVRDLPEIGDQSVARRALVQSLVHGGQYHRRDHLVALRQALAEENPELRMRLDDLAEAIVARLDKDAVQGPQGAGGEPR